MIRKTITILMTGAALSLCGAEPRFGVQGGLSIPAGDLSDNAYLGLQAGAHAKWDLRDGHGLMPRIDLSTYGSHNGVSVNNAALACDYTYHFDRRASGPYALAGVNLSTYHTSGGGFSSNDSSLGLDLGAGYDVDRHLGFQGRYTTNSFSGVTYGALTAAVTYTF